MSQNGVVLIGDDDDFLDIQDLFNNAVQDLVSHSAYEERPMGDKLYDYMTFVDSDASPKVFEIYDGSSWHTIFKLAANGGMVLHNGDQEMTGDLDMDGNDIILDADGDTKIVNDTDDEISFELGGAEEYLFTATVADFKGNYIKNCKMVANTNTPSGTTSYQVEFQDSSGTTVYVPGYAAAWTP